MTHILAIANQKGGVGKTTSAVSLSYDLSVLGYRVLLVDFDPQGSASSGLGLELPEEGEDLFDFFFGRISLADIIRKSPIENVWVAPASRDLVGIEIELGKVPGRELILKSGLASIKSQWDVILIDCPPSSGLLTLNALGASEKVIIPLQAEYYALEGLTALMRTLEFVRHTFNPGLEILGVFVTMFDTRTNLSEQVEREAKNFFQDVMFESKVPRNIKLSECPSHGLPIGIYDPASSGAKAYRELAIEIIHRLRLEGSPRLVANA